MLFMNILLQIFRNRKILIVYIKWIRNFLINKSITIKIYEEELQRFIIRTDIS